VQTRANSLGAGIELAGKPFLEELFEKAKLRFKLSSLFVLLDKV
jgi:hypothetical protein